MALSNFLPDIRPGTSLGGLTSGALGATAVDPNAVPTEQVFTQPTALQQFAGIQPLNVTPGSQGATGVGQQPVQQPAQQPAQQTGIPITSNQQGLGDLGQHPGSGTTGKGGFLTAISGLMGFDTSASIEGGLEAASILLKQGIQQIGLTADQAKNALAQGTLNASDILSAGLQSSQGFISEGQAAALGQIDQQFAQAEQALGVGRSDISQGFQEAIGGLGEFSQPGLAGLQEFARGSTAQGFGQQLQELQQSGVLQPLIDARTGQLQSTLGAAGLSRAGAGFNQLANIPQEVLLGIQNQLAGQQLQLGQQGLGAQGQIAGLQAGGAQGLSGIQGNIAQLLAQQGQLGAGIQGAGFENLAQLAQGTAQSQAGLQQGLGQQLAPVFVGQGQDIASLLGAQGQLEFAGGKAIAKVKGEGIKESGNLAGKVIGALSDKRLKKNIVKVGELNGVNIYTFDANELGKEKGMTMTLGVIADEVEKIYPDLIGESQGFKTVNYTELLRRVA